LKKTVSDESDVREYVTVGKMSHKISNFCGTSTPNFKKMYSPLWFKIMFSRVFFLRYSSSKPPEISSFWTATFSVEVTSQSFDASL